jgi:hypothetical protein
VIANPKGTPIEDPREVEPSPVEATREDALSARANRDLEQRPGRDLITERRKECDAPRQREARLRFHDRGSRVPRT